MLECLGVLRSEWEEWEGRGGTGDKKRFVSIVAIRENQGVNEVRSVVDVGSAQLESFARKWRVASHALTIITSPQPAHDTALFLVPHPYVRVLSVTAYQGTSHFTIHVTSQRT